MLFILTVAACEAAIALALDPDALQAQRKSLDVSLWQELREPDQEPIEDEEPLPARAEAGGVPAHLTPAGREPAHRSRRRSAMSERCLPLADPAPAALGAA